MAGALSLFFSLLLVQSPFTDSVENLTYDLRARVYGHWLAPSEDVVVIGITNDTLRRMDRALGRFPWPRVIYAPIVDICREAKAFGFDILLTESEARFSALPQEPFLEFVKDAGNVISVFHAEAGPPQKDTLFPKGSPWSLGPAPEAVFEMDYSRAIVPFPDLLEASRGIGHVNSVLDPDGSMRRYAMALSLRKQAMPSLALAMYVAGQGAHPTLSERGELKVGPHQWHLKDKGTICLVMPRDHYKVYDFADLLQAWDDESGENDSAALRQEFKDKYVILGCMATGLPFDRIATPVAANYPGMMVHAAALQGLLEGRRFIVFPPWSAILLGLLLALIAAWPERTAPGWKVMTALILLMAYLLLAVLLVWGFEWMIPVILPATAMGAYAITSNVFCWMQDRRRKMELERLEAAKQQFTDMLVHDLKGRMGTMLVSLEGLREYLPEDRVSQRAWKGLASGGSRMVTQISALLDIRRMEEGAMKLDMQPVSICEQLEMAVREHQHAAEITGMTLQLDCEERQQGPLSLDPQILQRILANLLWNAILYGKRGLPILVKAQSRKEGVEIAIRNHGRIIPEKEQSRLFTPFVSLGGSRNVSSVGSGLGLAFCKLATEAMGGSIVLYSPIQNQEDGVEVILRFTKR